VQQFESAQLSRGSGRRGQKGGHWSACTHLGMFKMFGLNTAPLLMRFLASLQPQEALEIGCGLGTTADYLARFSSGGSQVSCVEPEPMLAEVFAQRAFPMRAAQLSVDLFAQEDTRPEACFNALLTRRFPLVYSFEVAEHIFRRTAFRGSFDSSLLLPAACSFSLRLAQGRGGQGTTAARCSPNGSGSTSSRAPASYYSLSSVHSCRR
jgi:SAM-dependent methyltransferase